MTLGLMHLDEAHITIPVEMDYEKVADEIGLYVFKEGKYCCSKKIDRGN